MIGNFLNSDAFWGAIIGAIGSIAGGFFASMYQTGKQIKIEENRQRQKIKESAVIIHGDIITLIKAMLYYRNKDKMTGFYLNYSMDYSSHIDMLSDRIGGNKTYLLRKIYGHLTHLQKSIMLPTIDYVDIKMLVIPNYEAACELFYGSREEFVANTGHLGESLTEENYNQLIDRMENKIQQLLKTLDEIRLGHV